MKSDMGRLLRLPRPSLRRLGIVHDILVACLSITIAMSISWGLAPLLTLWQIWTLIAAYTALSAIAFPFFRLNSGAWRYASLLDAMSIVKAVTVVNAIFLLGSFLLFRGAFLPRTTVVTSWFIMIVGLGGPRLAYRLMKERYLPVPAMPLRERGGTIERRSIIEQTLLYGFNDDADLFIRNARRARSQATILGIIDDRPKNQRRHLHGVEVLGTLSNLGDLSRWAAKRATPIGEIVVTNSRIAPDELSDVVAAAAALSIPVKRLPDINRTGIVDRNAPIEPLPVSLEDLLGRNVVDLEVSKVAELIQGRIVVVTGAGGSIGSELVRQIGLFRPRLLVLVENSEFNLWQVNRQANELFPSVPVLPKIADVRNARRIATLFEEIRPDVVFHAAALKHVPIVEDNPVEGIETNLLGTRNVADAALAVKASAFVMVSSDKAVNPTNVMGATKRAAEAYCQALDLAQDTTRFVTVRFGNVLGSTGSVIPLFKSQLENRGPITVTHPQITRFFMTISEASRLILHAAGHGISDGKAKGQIYVLDMGEPVRIVELAERLIQLAGLRPNVDIKIEYVGLRPGEKLFEELFGDGETREETDCPGLMIARSRVSDVKLLSRSFEVIAQTVEAGDQRRALEILGRIVPEYSPSPTDRPQLRSVDLGSPRDPIPAIAPPS